jgi:hypothetical protein
MNLPPTRSASLRTLGHQPLQVIPLTAKGSERAFDLSHLLAHLVFPDGTTARMSPEVHRVITVISAHIGHVAVCICDAKSVAFDDLDRAKAWVCERDIERLELYAAVSRLLRNAQDLHDETERCLARNEARLAAALRTDDLFNRR